MVQRAGDCGAAAVRAACGTMQAMTHLPAADLGRVHAALAGVVISKGALPQTAWYSAAEAAVRAIYALHPAPSALMGALLRRLAESAFGGAADGLPLYPSA